MQLFFIVIEDTLYVLTLNTDAALSEYNAFLSEMNSLKWGPNDFFQVYH